MGLKLRSNMTTFSSLLNIKNQISLFEITFAIGLSLIPIAVIEGSWLSYADIKICVYLFISSICTIQLLTSKERLSISPYLSLFFFYVLLKIGTLGPIINLGLKLQSISLTISTLIVGLWVFNFKPSPKLICWALIPGALCAIGNSLSMYIYRSPLFLTMSPFGAPIGTRNSLSVFLCQLIPVYILLIVYSKNIKGIPKLASCLVFYLLLTLSMTIVFLGRTRSAWWMILTILTLTLGLKTKEISLKFPMTTIAIGVISSLTVLTLISTDLKWRSSTPYSDSFQSMFSIHSSSGRDALWTVGLKMVSDSPFTGIGSGNYATKWQEYIGKTDLDPKIFGFLRQDLPILNDYLQSFIENGIFTGILFCLLFLFSPLYFFIEGKKQLPELLMLMTCISLSIDAFFDYPFNRAENSILFITFLTLSQNNTAKIQLQIRKELTTPILCVCLVFSSIICTKLGLAILNRKIFYQTANLETLKFSWHYWPWDLQWNSRIIDQLYTQNNSALAEEISTQRIKYWPNDPESHLMLAIVNENLGKTNDALDNFKKALTKVEFGQCYKPAYLRYLKFSKAHNTKTDDELNWRLLSCTNNH